MEQVAGKELSILPMGQTAGKELSIIPNLIATPESNDEEDHKVMPKPCAPVAHADAGAPLSTKSSKDFHLMDKGDVAGTLREEDASGYEPSESAARLLVEILKCDADDIVWIVQKLKAQLHPDVGRKFAVDDAAEIQSAMSWTAEHIMARRSVEKMARASVLDLQETSAVSAEGQPPMMQHGISRNFASWMARCSVSDETPTVQFSSFMYFCKEGDVVKIDVMRIGILKQRSEVKYKTTDATAKAGIKYEHKEGTLDFEPGDDQKTIEIKTLDNDKWETTLEFVVELCEKGKNNARLGLYLYQARVKIIDDDAFPTEKYRKEIVSGDLNDVSTWIKHFLLLEYFKMVWQDAKSKSCTIKMIAVDQLHNFYFLLELFMNVYLVDYVLNLEKPEHKLVAKLDRDAQLVAIVALALVPFLGFHLIDYKRLNWELSAADLQRNLLRKFLNYDENSRAQLREGNLIMAMTRDSVKLVSGGYMKTIALVRAIGKLLMILVYQFASPFAFDRTSYFSESTYWVFSFGPLIVLPLLLITFLSCRYKKNHSVIDDRDEKEDKMIIHVNHAVTNYRLIADYHARPRTVEDFQDLIEDYDEACKRADQVFLNNSYFQKEVAICLVAATTLFLGREVSKPEDPYPLGMFLANVAICNYIGQSCGEIYQVLMSMEQVLPALLQITWLMNLKTDVESRMGLTRYRNEKTREARKNLRKTLRTTLQGAAGQEQQLPIDMLNITLQNLKFSYEIKGRPMSLNFSGEMDIEQGWLVALVGHRGKGKTTLLKILGGAILPTANQETHASGQVFNVPSHLRVLHVSLEPMFFHGSLLENLLFGVPSDNHPDGRPERVKQVCELLSLPASVTGFLDNHEKLDWDEVFSHTQLVLLSLARALIANPEMLCIHKPTMSLDVKTSAAVLQLLKFFVEQKGICQDPNKFHLRRPRTCIITISRHEALHLADIVYLVEEDRVSKIRWQEVTPALLQ